MLFVNKNADDLKGRAFMKKKTIALLTASLLTGASLFSACGSTNTSSGGSSSGSVDETQKITVWAWDDKFNVAIMKTAAEYYNKLKPDAKVEIEVIPNSKEDVYKKLQTGLASGGKSLPDITLVEDYSISQYLNAYSKYFYALNDDINYDEFSPYKVEVMTYKDKVYGIPFDSGVTGMFFRRDLIEQAGLTEAALQNITWDEFIEVGKTVKEKTGTALTVVSAANYSSLFRLMIQSAGQWYFNGTGDITVENNTALKEALEVTKRMRDSGVLLEVQDDAGVAAAINGGTTATVVNAAWRVSTIKAEASQNGAWGLAPTPRLDIEGGVNASNTGGSSWYVLDNGQDKAPIIDFLKTVYAGEKDFYSQILVDQGALCTWLPAQESTAFDTPDAFFGGQQIYKDFSSWLKEIPAVNYGEHVSEANAAVNAATYNYLQGTTDVDTALKEAQAQLKNQIGG